MHHNGYQFTSNIASAIKMHPKWTHSSNIAKIIVNILTSDFQSLHKLTRYCEIYIVDVRINDIEN